MDALLFSLLIVVGCLATCKVARVILWESLRHPCKTSVIRIEHDGDVWVQRRY